MNKYAPIALFVYSRLEHTKKVVESLKMNKEAKDSELIIFSDGPKNIDVLQGVSRVREYIRTIEGFKSVKLVFRNNNLGLANSLISGITELCNKYGKVIILEDDLILSPYFLKFMNDSLSKYENDYRIAGISGFVYKPFTDNFFLTNFSCWGWATWKRSWDLFNPNPVELRRQLLKKKLVKHLDLDFNAQFFHMLELQIEGKIDSWAIRCLCSWFVNDKLIFYPNVSLVSQNGMDGSGVHCGKIDNPKIFQPLLSDKEIELTDITIEENKEAYYLLKQINRSFLGKKAYISEKILQLKIFLGLVK